MKLDHKKNTQVSQLTTETALKPIQTIKHSPITAVSNIQELESTQSIQPVKPIEISPTLTQVDSIHSPGSPSAINALFYQFVTEQKAVLVRLALQVRQGELNEEAAEHELLLLILTQHLQLPSVVAKQMLPSFSQILQEQEGLREGLHSLWKEKTNK